MLKDLLKDETGGTNLEAMVAIGVASIIVVSIYNLGATIYSYIVSGNETINGYQI